MFVNLNLYCFLLLIANHSGYKLLSLIVLVLNDENLKSKEHSFQSIILTNKYILICQMMQ